MYNPDGGSRLYLIAEKVKRVQLAPIVAALNCLPAPIIEATWNGESAPLLPIFFSPGTIALNEAAAVKPAAFGARHIIKGSPNTVGYVQILVSPQRRPKGRMPIEIHAKVGSLLNANRWYPLAVATSQRVTLPSGQIIQLIAAPVFIATKLEAFKDRGRDANGQLDFLGSHDLEDTITVVDRRPELTDECRTMPVELREYLAQEFSVLFANADFEMTIAGHLPGDAASQSRLGKLKTTLRSFTGL